MSSERHEEPRRGAAGDHEPEPLLEVAYRCTVCGRPTYWARELRAWQHLERRGDPERPGR